MTKTEFQDLHDQVMRHMAKWINRSVGQRKRDRSKEKPRSKYNFHTEQRK